MTTNNNTTGFNTEEFVLIEMQAEDFNKEDVMHYLEDGITNGTLEEVEEDVYYDIKLTGKCKKWKLEAVKNNMVDMYNEKF